MQDLKNLSRQRRSSLFNIFNSGRANRKITRTEEHPRLQLPIPTGKQRERLKYLLLFIALVLALTPVAVLIFSKGGALLNASGEWFRSFNARPTEAVAAKQPPASSFSIASNLLDEAVPQGDHLAARSADGLTLHYSIRGDLQKRVHDFMAANQVPYGVFVAIEPSSGRILAMTAYSAADPTWARDSYFELYPMASLFKIITASAALENRKITPETVIEFRGNATSENPRYWEINPKGRNNRMDVTYAMGKSINPVYGRLARDVAGKESVMASANRFGFNQQLLKGTPAKESQAGEPQTGQELMRMGAGLDHDVKISPLHAAVMMAAIANNGRMMAPILTDRVTDAQGTDKDSSAPREIRNLVTPETAASLTRMLSSTVTTGTSRRAFHDRRGRPLLNIDVAAKTGSISGTDPRGHYSWFAAFAPAKNPRIALVSLVINQDKWKIKSSQVGEQALEEFFNP